MLSPFERKRGKLFAEMENEVEGLGIGCSKALESKKVDQASKIRQKPQERSQFPLISDNAG